MRACIAVLSLVAFAPVARGQMNRLPDDSLAGIWAAEVTFGPALEGTLVMRRDGAGWRAAIGSAEARAPLAGDSVRLAFAGGLGAFRGVLGPDGTVRGFWVQPPGVVYSQSFASPLVLSRGADGAWRGAVVPLPQRYTLYLELRRSARGYVVGTFRNPEMNHNARWLQFRVDRTGDTLAFAVCGETCATPDTSAGATRLAGTVRASPRRIELPWAPLGATLTLTPRAEAQAVGLFARLPRGVRYRYAKPPATGDGWATARAADVGMDETTLAAMVQGLADTLPWHPRAPLVHSVLVARRGRLVLEEYFAGFDRDTPHDVRSVGKTFASVLLGAAMRRGMAIGPETPLARLLAADTPFANPDARKARITLAHLMTHTSGLACDDNDETSPGNEGAMQSQRAQPDWARYTIGLPQAFDPGAHYAYCSGGMNLMAGALSAATHAWIPALFDREVARPLDFGRWYFNLTPTGEGYLGGGAHLRPRDLLKVGQTWLDGGVWRGRRIVAREWVERSTARQVAWDARDQNVPAGEDGFAWHRWLLHAGERSLPAYVANGNGGQLLIVVPAESLVVVFTAGNYGHGGVWTRFGSELVPRYVVGAIRR